MRGTAGFLRVSSWKGNCWQAGYTMIIDNVIMLDWNITARVRQQNR